MAPIYLICAAYAIYCLITNPGGPLTSPDSAHYLRLSPLVPLGYPLVLQVTGAGGAIVVQPVLYAAALAFLGREVVRLTQQRWLALLLVAGAMAAPQIRDFHASILSESLFLSLLVIFLALAVRFAHYPTWHLMACLATTVGVAATVRRTAVALVPVMLVMILQRRHHLRGSQAPLVFVAALAPFAAIMATEQAIAPLAHAGASASLLDRHLFAKAVLIDAPPAPATSGDPARAALDAELEQAYAPIRGVLSRAPGDVRGVLTLFYETCFQGPCADAARAATGASSEEQQTQLMGEAGLARIRRAPLGYVQLTWRHYRSLWVFDRLGHPDTAAALNAFLAAERPLPFEDLAFALGPERSVTFTSAPHVRYVQWALTLAGVVSGMMALGALAAALAGWRLPPLAAAAGIAALALHAGLMLTALLAAGTTRFLLGLWPAIVASLCLGGALLLQKKEEKKIKKSS